MSEASFKLFTPSDQPTSKQIHAIASFLHDHLDQFGDPVAHIKKAMRYSVGFDQRPGGFTLVALDKDAVIGTVVINKTGMSGYIPENILVYIAVHDGYRGKGIGKQLMQQAIRLCDGSVALHVEPDNPARKLYEKLGFENKYLEMRFQKPSRANTLPEVPAEVQ